MTINATNRATGVIAVLILAAAFGGCATSHDDLATSNEAMLFWIEPSHTELLVGETSTITGRSANLIERDAEVKWKVSEGGDLETIQDGRVARVTFKDPGVYTVVATLYIDGRQYESKAVDIKVSPLT